MSTLNRVVLVSASLTVVLCMGCRQEAKTSVKPTATVAAGAKSAKVFVDVTLAAGITHRHHKPILDHKLDNIMAWVASVGAAAAAGDYDNDGWLDLYVTDSRKGTPNYLYRNNGDGTFTDVAKAAGVADVNGDGGTSMDCAWGDIDNDGWIDLYVVRWGTDLLFRNNGDGTFTDVTGDRFRKPDGSPGTPWANGNAVIFFDYNLDGRLDVYVGNYFEPVDLWHLSSTRIMHDDFEKSRNGGRNFLYRQEPDGTFVEQAQPLGVDDPGWTLAVGSADVNNDGWPDLYCADDFGPDQLFLNRRDGTFADASESALGLDTKKGMNVDFGDFNNDGWLDIYITNITTAEYLQEGNMLWHNNGPTPDGSISFTDISLETGTYDGGWAWGAKFFDYDNDRDLDIVVANGFITAGEGNYWYDLASWTVMGQDSADAKNWPAIGDRSFSGHETMRFFGNDGVYSFTQRAAELGLDSTRDGRGVVTFDYDNDGDLDLFVANQDQAPLLYRNDGDGGNHWIMMQLEADPGTGINRDAIGARVTIVTPSGRQIRERDGGNGYCGQSDPRLHFGLGSDDHVQLLEVRWPDGGLQYLENVRADQVVTIRQQPDRYASKVAITVDLPKPWSRSKRGRKRAPVAPAPEDINERLARMEEQLRTRPPGFTLASDYRSRCATNGQHDRSIAFFEKLVADDPSDYRARIGLACACIDKIPTCGGIAAIVSKGTLARKALIQLDEVIAKHDRLWVAYYCRGINHLHWPRALRHSDRAAADLARCLELQPRDASGRPEPYLLRVHLGLGDAFAKAKRYALARQAWRTGLVDFPGASELAERLAITDDGELLEYVELNRSLDRPIDTSLSFLDP